MRRTIVITGASSGIGRALALRYAREGAKLGLLGRNLERLETCAAACRVLGAEVVTYNVDVRAREALKLWLERFDEASAIDLLIANAGVMEGTRPGGAVEPPDAAFALIETNVLGVLNTVQPLIDPMSARGRGQIVIVSSLSGFIPLADSPSYCASKSAVLSYGLSLRAALERRSVGVSVVCPGYVTTPMASRESGPKPLMMSAEKAADLIARRLERNPPVIAFPPLLAFLARLGGLMPERIRQWSTARFTVAAPD